MEVKCNARRCHAMIIWPHNVFIFSHKLPATHFFGIKAQFIIRKEEPIVQARIRKR